MFWPNVAQGERQSLRAYDDGEGRLYFLPGEGGVLAPTGTSGAAVMSCKPWIDWLRERGIRADVFNLHRDGHNGAPYVEVGT